MALEISEDNLKHGLLGLVIALVEFIKDALKLQAPVPGRSQKQ